MQSAFETIRITNPGFPEYQPGFDYVGACIAQAKPGSEFGKKLKELPESSGAERLRLLLLQHYDGLLFLKGERIVGHVFWQRHTLMNNGVPLPFPNDMWNMFSVVSHDEGYGHGREFLIEFLRVAHEEDALRVSLGAGGNAWVNAFWREACHKDLGLPFKTKPGFSMWEVEFEEPTAA